MSSSIGGSKKLAIINSQNTARSLKFAERPVQINKKRTKGRASEHQVEDIQLPATAISPIDSSFEVKSDLDDVSDTSFPSETNIRSHSRATSSVDSRVLFCSNDSYESNQHHSASDPLMHGNALHSPSFSSSCMKDEVPVPAPLLSPHNTTLEYPIPLATPKSNVLTMNEESVAVSCFISHSDIQMHDPYNLVQSVINYFPFQEFFALSKGPVTIDDFCIGGESLSLRPREGAPNLTTIMRPPLTNAVSPSFSVSWHVHWHCG